MAGPFCTMMLADMGAEVIKIEQPGGRRHARPGLEPRPATRVPYLDVNRNKRGMTLDLKAGGRASSLVAPPTWSSRTTGPARWQLGLGYETL